MHIHALHRSARQSHDCSFQPIRYHRGHMRIALVSSCWTRTPPLGYGGTELVVGELARGLVDRGHDVTVFTTGDSEASGTLRSRFRAPRTTAGTREDVASAPFKVAKAP